MSESNIRLQFFNARGVWSLVIIDGDTSVLENIDADLMEQCEVGLSKDLNRFIERINAKRN